MNNIVKYGMSAMMLLASVVTFSSCEDWTDPESLELKSPSIETQNPQLYADYLKDLNTYKAEDHRITIISFDNSLVAPAKQAERLTALPDSIDFVCLNNPMNIHPELQAEMVKVHEKGIRTIYSINYASFEAAWKEMEKANPKLTEEDALAYLGERTDAMLALCDKNGFDGIIVDYVGHSLVSLPEDALKQYNDRQKNFFGKVMDWQSTHSGKTLAFFGNIQYLVAENMGMLNKYDYIILKTASSTNADDLTLKAYWAIQAGMDAAAAEVNGVSPVPIDRFVVCVELPLEGDKDQVKGYWNTVDTNGNKMLAAPSAAQWMLQESVNYVRKGIFVLNVHDDYYHNTYGYVRDVIRIMNPNK